MNINNAFYSNLHQSYLTVFPQGPTVTKRAHGIDVSKYDLLFNPGEATGQLDFVVQRASYRTTKDEAFDQLHPGVLKVPLRGAYHYLNADTNWRYQADKFLEVVSGKGFQFYACDFEEAFNTLSLSFVKAAWDWIHYVHMKTDQPVILYTSWNLYNQWIFPSQAKYGINWNEVPYWQAQWFLTPNPNGTPSMPTGRTSGWELWQYTDKGNGPQYGVARPTACDLDVFNGTPEEMRNWLGVSETQPSTPPEDEPATPLNYVGFRALHRSEGGRWTPNACPCVIPSLNIAGIEFTRPIQICSYELASTFNPNVTKAKWRIVYKYNIAFTNNQGFDKPNDSRLDWVNQRNLNRPLPRLMKAIICAGNFYTGTVVGNKLVMTPGVNAIDGNKPMPRVKEILEKHWYFVATTARSVLGTWRVSNFPQGGQAPVLIPFILKEPAMYDLSWFERWESNALPDPLKVYHPK